MITLSTFDPWRSTSRHTARGHRFLNELTDFHEKRGVEDEHGLSLRGGVEEIRGVRSSPTA
jgi:hypothetical protein